MPTRSSSSAAGAVGGHELQVTPVDRGPEHVRQAAGARQRGVREPVQCGSDEGRGRLRLRVGQQVLIDGEELHCGVGVQYAALGLDRSGEFEQGGERRGIGVDHAVDRGATSSLGEEIRRESGDRIEVGREPQFWGKRVGSTSTNEGGSSVSGDSCGAGCVLGPNNS